MSASGVGLTVMLGLAFPLSRDPCRAGRRDGPHQIDRAIRPASALRVERFGDRRIGRTRPFYVSPKVSCRSVLRRVGRVEEQPRAGQHRRAGRSGRDSNLSTNSWCGTRSPAADRVLRAIGERDASASDELRARVQDGGASVPRTSPPRECPACAPAAARSPRRRSPPADPAGVDPAATSWWTAVEDRPRSGRPWRC